MDIVRIENGKVSQKWENTTIERVRAKVPSDWTLLAVEPRTAFCGMTYDGNSSFTAPPRVITEERVNDEWQRRLNSSFQFGDKTYAADQDSHTTILLFAQWAADAVAAHVQAGNLFWQADDPSNPTTTDLPFAYKAMDGTLVEMDAPTVVEFGKALSQYRQAHFRAAQALKAMTPIPTDYRDDKYWP